MSSPRQRIRLMIAKTIWRQDHAFTGCAWPRKLTGDARDCLNCADAILDTFEMQEILLIDVGGLRTTVLKGCIAQIVEFEVDVETRPMAVVKPVKAVRATARAPV